MSEYSVSEDGCEYGCDDAEGISCSGEIPEPVQDEIHSAVDAIRDLMQLEEIKPYLDEDGRKTCTQETNERAVEFLRTQARLYTDEKHRTMDAPVPRLCPSGSIDLWWNKLDRPKGREETLMNNYRSEFRYVLLVNIPVEPDKPITFYGHNEAGRAIRYGEPEEAGPEDDIDLNKQSLILEIQKLIQKPPVTIEEGFAK